MPSHYRLMAVLFTVVLFGCASQPEAPTLEVEKQTLHQRTLANGEQEFAFIVTVAPTPAMQLDTSKPISRRALKAYAEFERIEDSPSLKLQLEERAVKLLGPALNAENYCNRGHAITDVYWRQRSVQLRGKCL